MTEQQPMTLTDWRGNSYTVGTLILYPRGMSGSADIQEAEVLDIYEAVYDTDALGWVRFDPTNTDHEGKGRETRVKVRPTNRSSRHSIRSNHHIKQDQNGETVRDEHGHPVWDTTAPAKPVTLMIISNITVADTGGSR